MLNNSLFATGNISVLGFGWMCRKLTSIFNLVLASVGVEIENELKFDFCCRRLLADNIC